MTNRLSELWKQTLNILSNELSRPSFDTWLKYTELLQVTQNKAIILTPNEFAKEWLETRYYNLIRNTLQLLLNQDIELVFILPEEEPDRLSSFSQNSRSPAPLDEHHLTPLNPKYTFDTFVVGDSNRFAQAACLAVAQSPAHAYNPLFIYGGVGLGKTHLMHAIGHYVLAHSPQHRVLYVSSEKFTNDLINAIRDDKTEEFRARYRNIDVLLIDDIQFLAGKERTQEEFFHTFNALHEANRQIVISSDRPPKAIPTLEDRLRSRFEWGLITDIQPPDLETRIAILKKKASLEQLSIPNDVLVYIATLIQTNIRELEGALVRLGAYNSLTNNPITLETAAHALKDMAGFAPQQPITISLIQEHVANYFGLRVQDLKGKKRTRQLAFPRQIAMYLCRELTQASLPYIGQEFGGRDHTTVIHACDKITGEMKNDPAVAKIVQDLLDLLQNPYNA